MSKGNCNDCKNAKSWQLRYTETYLSSPREAYMFAKRFFCTAGRGLGIVVVLCALALRATLAADSEAPAVAAAEARLSATVQHLASDELEGRGVGTKGIDLAADYIAEQYRAIG